ncbi:OB-fold domain-containing protein [Mycolicibacterium vanbaalenii]|uniref:Zn-ribbon domain-containing OB-fold protein n=1 Tax=Mycolicibacterium vanbaalenii TaxID=110539 RepID=UPI0035C78A41|nr:OB-fold domain-containing protein [Mycolicibacterium vanbaalenii]
MSASTQPAIDGWFATDGRAVDSGPDGRAVDSGPDGRAVDSATDGSGDPYLIGGKCHECGTFVFPPRANNCPNPGCGGDELAQVPLSRRGTLWSYTENRYAPPPPYPSPDPFEPFAVAAVELADEGLIVLGKVVEGTLAADLTIGMQMELTTMPLYIDDDGTERIVYAWRIAQ